MFDGVLKGGWVVDGTTALKFGPTGAHFESSVWNSFYRIFK
jgi:hypothetical protein